MTRRRTEQRQMSGRGPLILPRQRVSTLSERNSGGREYHSSTLCKLSMRLFITLITSHHHLIHAFISLHKESRRRKRHDSMGLVHTRSKTSHETFSTGPSLFATSTGLARDLHLKISKQHTHVHMLDVATSSSSLKFLIIDPPHVG